MAKRGTAGKTGSVKTGRLMSLDVFRGMTGMILLSFLFVIIDIWGLQGWTGFFNTFGTNPMFTYLLAGIWTKTMLAVKIGEVTLYNWIFTHLCSPLFADQKIASLMFALMQVCIIWAFGYILYRKKNNPQVLKWI